MQLKYYPGFKKSPDQEERVKKELWGGKINIKNPENLVDPY